MIDRNVKMLDVAEQSDRARCCQSEQAVYQSNLNEKQMTLSLTISRDGLADKRQSAVMETVKKLTDPLSAAVSKTDTQRNFNAVS